MLNLKGQDILSAKQFDREILLKLFKIADKLREEIREKKVLNYAKGRIMATVFLEPSTRTKLSFQFAMKRLGGDVIDFDVTTSSLAKGETDIDTLRIIDGYEPDIIVLRQRKPLFPMEIKDLIKAPIINAGDGWNEHPTQALLDVYTIWREFGKVNGLRIGIMDDLKYGRTPSSLSYLLSKFNNIKIYYIAPKPLQIREDVLQYIEGKIEYEIVYDVTNIIEKLDVLYVTRLQKERLPDQSLYEKLKGSYKLTADLLLRYKKIPLIMHPLPRTWELDTSVDTLPQAKYFEQAKNGLYIRAALIKEVLGV